MNVKKSYFIAGLILMFLLGSTTTIIADSKYQNITAELNKTMKILLNGEEFKSIDSATGNQYYPLLYNGRTYLPLRAVANALNIAVDYDGDTETVFLGKKAKGKFSLIDIKNEHTGINPILSSKDTELLSYNGKGFESGIINEKGRPTATGKYIINKMYSTLTFSAYVLNAPAEVVYMIYDDDKNVALKTIYLNNDSGIVDVTANVSGVSTLRIEMTLPNPYVVGGYDNMSMRILNPQLE